LITWIIFSEAYKIFHTWVVTLPVKLKSFRHWFLPKFKLVLMSYLQLK
jgi:hypothetical protein